VHPQSAVSVSLLTQPVAELLLLPVSFAVAADNCVPDVNGTICSGNGYCEENTSQCVCKKNFDGARCERDICGGVYCGGESNGFCNNGTCVCYEGWGGVNCTEDLCAGKDCGHGSCYNGNCQCEWGWAGANCTEIGKCCSTGAVQL
jgi:syndecan 4